MPRKKNQNSQWKKYLPISPWYFLVLAVISTAVCIFAMRQNNLAMVALRDEVFKADKENTDVEEPLRKLREYVYSHMNTNLNSGNNNVRPPIQLKYRYERLVQAEKDRVSARNESVYTEAQAICEQQFPTGISGGGRVPCIEEYVSANGISEQPVPEGLYKFDFVAPAWTPDLAGWSMLAAIIFFGLFILRIGLERWVRFELNA